MIFPDKLDPKNVKVFTEATQIALRIEKTSKTPDQIDVGDFVVIALKDCDITGTVVDISHHNLRGYSLISLKTDNGIENVKIRKSCFIHIIKKANMELKEHDSYERDLHNIENKGVPTTQKSKYYTFPPTTKEDKKVDSEKTSELPAAKKLSLRKYKKAYQFAASDIVRSASGIPSQIVEIIPGDETQAAMAVLRSTTGNTYFVEFLTDLTPIKSGKKLSLKRKMLSLRDKKSVCAGIAKGSYGKSYDSLSNLEKLDVDDHILKLS